MASGSARDIVDRYVSEGSDLNRSLIDLDAVRRIGHYGYGQRLRLERLEWISGLPLQHGEPLRARIEFRALHDVEDVALGIGFSTPEGVRLVTYETDFQTGYRPSLKGGTSFSLDVSIPQLPLAPGVYLLDVGSRSGDFFGLDYLPGVSQIEIVMGPKTPGYIVRQAAGVRLESEWTWLPAASGEAIFADKSRAVH